jgi:hypothetical protein
MQSEKSRVSGYGPARVGIRLISSLVGYGFAPPSPFYIGLRSGGWVGCPQLPLRRSGERHRSVTTMECQDSSGLRDTCFASSQLLDYNRTK